jgi:hypothetical protein
MVQAIATLVLFLSLGAANGAAHGAGDETRHRGRGCGAWRDTHVRATVPALADALAAGVRESPTLQALVDRIEASDLLVYLTLDRAPRPSAAGHISLMAAVAGRRYVRLALNPRYDGSLRIAILAHELRHAVEIADALSVTDERSLASLYRRIGFTSGERSFESDAAIAAGRQVHDEVLRKQRRRATH